MNARFTVVGSINMDLVAQVDSFPAPGETRTGKGFGTYPGGKGANQAVALARLGAKVTMAGKIGDDLFGSSYKETFNREGVDQRILTVESGVSTGVAVIEVDDEGENHIVIVPGANGMVDRDYIDRNIEAIAASDFVLFQLEIPLDTIEYTLGLLAKREVTTILDPAPAPSDPLPPELLKNVDLITPNESEAYALTGIKVTDEKSAAAAGASLKKQGAGRAIIKAGGAGAYLIEESGVSRVGGFTVDVADTTAAGDAFNAGLAFALGNDKPMAEAIRYGNAVGALACTALGAQSAMPRIADLQSLLRLQ
ncbi:MAG: ribokinase [Alkalispirochaetaceae bacterium]